jgi:predicted component of type VI protein secretion system
MAHRISGPAGRQMAKVAIRAILISGLLIISGCSSSDPTAAQQAALAKTELHFDINACQQIEPGLYKCPAADKPICNPDYNGQAECVRIGPKGSVFVQSGFAN